MELTVKSLPAGSFAALMAHARGLSDSAMERVCGVLADAHLRKMVRRYEHNLSKQKVDVGFNLFELISDYYYRETLHSDILRALLEPTEKHGEGPLFLRLFLLFLQSRGAEVSINNYQNPRAIREEGRIDVLIKDETTKHAIIIENKINNAPDMPRQLPGYLADVRAKGYTCDAIIYLRLSGNTGPDTTDWTERDCDQVSGLITVICVFDDSETDLLNGWVRRCERACTRHSDAEYVVRQYGHILRKLAGKVMNKPLMEDFYKIIIQDDNLKTALLLKSMIDDLILFRAERIVETFKNDLKPFGKISIYAGNDAYFTGLLWGEAHLGIDVVVEERSYVFQFWDRNDRDGKNSKAKQVLQNMGCQKDYEETGGLFSKSFLFPAGETDLISHIKGFKKKLGDHVRSN